MTDFAVVIPARMGATRLPGKPLADIGGRPMVVRVAERARQSGAREVWVATDHADVADAVRAHGFDVVMTGAHHASGTDRVAEAAAQLGWGEGALVVNVQGDEPLVDPNMVRQVAECLSRRPEAVMSTACYPLADVAALTNSAVVKVVLDKEGNALYFSRAPIPYPRDAFAQGLKVWPQGLPAYRHAGVYGYRTGFLARISGMEPAPLEGWEFLEQLRVLWHGYRIAVVTVEGEPAPAVDTPEDLERVRQLAAAR